MAKKRIPHSAEFKAKVALDALSATLRREQKTLAELSQDYKLQSTQISAFKNLSLIVRPDQLPFIFFMQPFTFLRNVN